MLGFFRSFSTVKGSLQISECTCQSKLYGKLSKSVDLTSGLLDYQVDYLVDFKESSRSNSKIDEMVGIQNFGFQTVGFAGRLAVLKYFLIFHNLHNLFRLLGDQVLAEGNLPNENAERSAVLIRTLF